MKLPPFNGLESCGECLNMKKFLTLRVQMNDKRMTPDFDAKLINTPKEVGGVNLIFGPNVSFCDKKFL